jgi:hypothetical protein
MILYCNYNIFYVFHFIKLKKKYFISVHYIVVRWIHLKDMFCF